MKVLIKSAFGRFSVMFLVFCMSLLLLISCKNKRNTVDQSKPPGKTVALDVEVSDMNIAEGTATLKWTALTSKETGTLKDGSAATVKGYDVEYSEGGSFSDDNSHEVHAKGNETSVILTDLKAGETYSFKVYAKNDNPNKKYSKGPYSDVKQFKFGEPSQAQAPGNPTELEATVTSYTVTVSFKPSETPGLNADGSTATITGYEGQISENQNFSDSSNVSVGPDMAGIVFSGLGPDTQYYVKIFTISNSTDQSKRKSDGVSFDNPVKTLPPGAEPPSAPTNVALEGRVEGNSATLKWSAPSDPGTGSDGFTPATITGYIVEICPNYDFFIDKISYAVDATSGADSESYQLNNLMLGQTYYARVFAVNDNDRNANTSLVAGDLEDVFTIPNEHAEDSEAPGMPSQFKAVAGVQSVELSWKEPDSYGKGINGNTLYSGSFEVELSSNSDFSDPIFGSNPTKSEDGIYKFVFDDSKHNITVGTEYYARVRTNNNSRYAGVLRYSPWLYLDSGDDKKDDKKDDEKNVVKTKLPEPPGMPTDLLLENLDDDADGKTKLRISWTVPENTGFYDPGNAEEVATIVKYTIYYGDEVDIVHFIRGGGDKGISTKDLEVTDNTKKRYTEELTGLTPGTSYSVYVLAVNNNPVKDAGVNAENTSTIPGDTSLMRYVTATTNGDFMPPSIPENPFVYAPPKPEGKSSIVVTWSASGDPGKNKNGSPATIENYILEYKSDESDSDEYKVVAVPASSIDKYGFFIYTITDLENSKTYRIRIAAVNENFDHRYENATRPFAFSSYTPEILGSTLDSSIMADASLPPSLAPTTSEDPNPKLSSIKVDIPAFTGSFGTNISGDKVTMARRVLDYYKVDSEYNDADPFWLKKNIEESGVRSLGSTIVTVDELDENSSYRFRIRVIPVVGDGLDLRDNTSYSTVESISTAKDITSAAAKPITPVISGDVGYNTITVQVPVSTNPNKFGFGAYGSPGNGRYILEMRGPNYDASTQEENDGFADTNKDVRHDATDVQEFEFEGLKPGSLYELRIVAIPTESESGDDKADKFKTAGDILSVNTLVPTKPTAPKSLTVDDGGITPTSVVLSWQAPDSNGGAEEVTYKVYYAKGDVEVTPGEGDVDNEVVYTEAGAVGIRLKFAIDALTATVEGLSKGTQYSFVVVTDNGTAISDPGNKVSTTTGTTPPGQPTGFNITDQTVESISLEWGVPDDNGGIDITRYSLYKSENQPIIKNDTNKVVGVNITTVGTTSTAEVSGLDANKEYFFAVYATNGEGDSESSKTSGYTIPNPPTEKDGVNPQARFESILINWQSSAGADPRGYKVYYHSGTPITPDIIDQINQIVDVPGGSTESAVVGHLVANTSYYFAIRAVGSGEQRLLSEPLIFSHAVTTIKQVKRIKIVAWVERGTIPQWTNHSFLDFDGNELDGVFRLVDSYESVADDGPGRNQSVKNQNLAPGRAGVDETLTIEPSSSAVSLASYRFTIQGGGTLKVKKIIVTLTDDSTIETDNTGDSGYNSDQDSYTIDVRTTN